ncbi:hypothetical protein NDU88_011304 [Pleurodeles waltl]|uniref:Uncharacterized protein n=1 Tax=Pleurodeles waltl TaxID=8319 RepID=A0AAV7QZN3_PLEWA|nr:hypothetical protein NDU88_011304 [Pleurodeles waltl]
MKIAVTEAHAGPTGAPTLLLQYIIKVNAVIQGWLGRHRTSVEVFFPILQPSQASAQRKKEGLIPSKEWRRGTHPGLPRTPSESKRAAQKHAAPLIFTVAFLLPPSTPLREKEASLLGDTGKAPSEQGKAVGRTSWWGPSEGGFRDDEAVLPCQGSVGFPLRRPRGHPEGYHDSRQ